MQEALIISISLTGMWASRKRQNIRLEIPHADIPGEAEEESVEVAEGGEGDKHPNGPRPVTPECDHAEVLSSERRSRGVFNAVASHFNTFKIFNSIQFQFIIIGKENEGKRK